MTQDGDSSLQTMLDHLAQGVAMFDASRRLVAWNSQLQELLDLSDILLSNTTSFDQFVGVLADRGDFGPPSGSRDAAVRALTVSLDDPYKTFPSSVGADEAAPLTRLISDVRGFEAGQPPSDDIAAMLLAISAPEPQR